MTGESGHNVNEDIRRLLTELIDEVVEDAEGMVQCAQQNEAIESDQQESLQTSADVDMEAATSAVR